MLLLSIDVGITNMAVCILDPETNIIMDWKIIDLQSETKTYCCKCSSLAKFTNLKGEHYFCGKHAQGFIKIKCNRIEKTNYSPTELATIEKNLYKKLKLSPSLSSSTSSSTTSASIEFIQMHAEALCITPLPKIKPTKSISLIDIGRSIKILFDNFLETFFEKVLENHTIKTIIIENQISPIATRMKTIQGMIAQYFIMKDSSYCIEFVSSSNKLKGSGKMSYKDRKKLGIERTQNFLNETVQSPLIHDMFTQSKKKDDLSDCLLQGLYWIKKGK